MRLRGIAAVAGVSICGLFAYFFSPTLSYADCTQATELELFFVKTAFAATRINPCLANVVPAASTDSSSEVISTRAASIPGSDFGAVSGLVGNQRGNPRLGNWAFWTAAANNWVRDTQIGADFAGSLSDVLVGADSLIAPNVLAGIAVGYKRIDLGTGFNQGTFRGDGFTVIPYATYIIDRNFAMSGQVGYAGMYYSEAHEGTTGSLTGNRWFGKADFHARTVVESWDLRGSVAFLYVNEAQTGFTESNGNFVPAAVAYAGTGQLKMSAGYRVPTEWGVVTPYGQVRLLNDFFKSDAPLVTATGTTANVGNFGAQFSVGANMVLGDNWRLIVEGNTVQFRTNYESYGVMASLRARF